MGLYLKQTDERSELQQSVAAELRRKAAESVKQEDITANLPEPSMNNAESMSGTMAFGILAVIAVLIIITFLILGGK